MAVLPGGGGGQKIMVVGEGDVGGSGIVEWVWWEGEEESWWYREEREVCTQNW